MVALLKANKRWTETFMLAALSAMCVLLSVFRVITTDSSRYIFLNWNLFLAFLPWALSTLAILDPRIQKSKAMVLFILGAWLLFFPNAPYILTDLFHLRTQTYVPIWFDLVLILSFSWAGLLFGFISLRDIESILGNWMSKKWTTILSAGLLFLAAFGIYLGRYLRWNSWDILSDPFGLLLDIADRFLHPFQNYETWGMTLLFGFFLNVVYWSFKMMRGRV